MEIGGNNAETFVNDSSIVQQGDLCRALWRGGHWYKRMAIPTLFWLVGSSNNNILQQQIRR